MEVFRDLGLAFAAVLVLIYVLVVGWFRSFITPLVIMAPIPLTLVGILPGARADGRVLHRDFDDRLHRRRRNHRAQFDHPGGLHRTAPRAGHDAWKHAVVDAGAVRFRPMLLTAAAVVVGASVILFDPIFQGLAISLMAGEVASTLLSRMAVPVLYYMVEKRKACRRPALLESRAGALGGTAYENRTWIATDGGSVRSALAGTGLLGKSLLVSVHRIRRTEPVAVGLHQLVPGNVDAGQVRAEIFGSSSSRRRCALACGYPTYLARRVLVVRETENANLAIVSSIYCGVPAADAVASPQAWCTHMTNGSTARWVASEPDHLRNTALQSNASRRQALSSA